VEQVSTRLWRKSVTSNDKILEFKRKLTLWKNHVVKGNLEIFPLLLGPESEEAYQQVLHLIGNHFEELQNRIEHYFASFSTQVHDWVNHPYSESSAQPENLTLWEEKELCKLQSDRINPWTSSGFL
jgi:hypothetical protein